MFPFLPNMYGNPRRHEAQDMHGRTTAASLSSLLFRFPGAFLIPAPALPWDGLPFPGQAFHRAEGLFVLLGTVCCAVPGVCFALPEGQERRGRGRGCELPCRNTKGEKGGPVYSSAQSSLSRQRDFLVFQSKTLKKGQGRGDGSCWGAEVLGEFTALAGSAIISVLGWTLQTHLWDFQVQNLLCPAHPTAGKVNPSVLMAWEGARVTARAGRDHLHQGLSHQLLTNTFPKLAKPWLLRDFLVSPAAAAPGLLKAWHKYQSPSACLNLFF